jgi:ribosomal protein S21
MLFLAFFPPERVDRPFNTLWWTFIRHAVCGTVEARPRMFTKMSDASKSPVWYGVKFNRELKEMISPQLVQSVQHPGPPTPATTRDEKSAAARIRHRKTELGNTINKDIIVVEDFDKANKRYKKAVNHSALQASFW